MYKIILIIENPQTSQRKEMTYKFDPATMSQAKWSGAYPAVQVQMEALVTESTPKEPATW